MFFVDRSAFAEPPVERLKELEKNKRSFDKVIQEALSLLFYHNCAYCGCEAYFGPGGNAQIDHFKPKSKHPECSYDWDNLVLSCNTCNGFTCKGSEFPILDPCDICESCNVQGALEYDFERGVFKLRTGVEHLSSKFNLMAFFINRFSIKQRRISEFTRMARLILELHSYVKAVMRKGEWNDDMKDELLKESKVLSELCFLLRMSAPEEAQPFIGMKILQINNVMSDFVNNEEFCDILKALKEEAALKT